jgi:succinyl-CoA synthetase beta subunit
VKKATKLMLALYEAFVATDASLLEINPLIVTGGGDLLALDAKMNFDDNALYRHPDIRTCATWPKRTRSRSRPRSSR